MTSSLRGTSKFLSGPNPHYSHLSPFSTHYKSMPMLPSESSSSSSSNSNFNGNSPPAESQFHGRYIHLPFHVTRFEVRIRVSRSVILQRTSSISSKGSLMSSRSNSSNSSSNSNSSCSSARTSTSEASPRKKLSTTNQARSVAVKSSNISHRFPNKEWQARNYCDKYGHSQRWQFISPVPVLNRRNSTKKRKGRKGKRERDVRKGVCRRFFGWLVSTCQECHAIEPSKRLKVSI
ncbi:uncharacterized protein LOC110896516 [Helianthus annuus]|uniref:uncharacterized protein LOC110896516 n=1 Tax=Helianthus annuus TaxID=4232 RepID=UPI001652F62D|nr:uncharacterized protein LOC110896516 [Helianthus annuus]